MIDDIDLTALRKIPAIGYYFRYPLHRDNFHELTVAGTLRGHYTAKPLYGRLTKEGRVDKSAGFNGDIAALFVARDATEAQQAEIFTTHVAPEKIVTADGKRNWRVINEAAAQYLADRILEGAG